ncbi:hypothetical protein SHJG_1365 [Streptomyces hygroscopicus subsp. jinggangensis 5008]|nr:hypothetical protein SHJG_1365 [Streptomyces hygroscopicus subsp. jinggangensis 5008]AGF60865.1 hypothetical protein SHJGH_1199 [Streptomyces hygroscopicus subsp. jinggangensis TL01]
MSPSHQTAANADAVIPGITRRHRAQSVVAARQPYPVG